MRPLPFPHSPVVIIVMKVGWDVLLFPLATSGHYPSTPFYMMMILFHWVRNYLTSPIFPSLLPQGNCQHFPSLHPFLFISTYRFSLLKGLLPFIDRFDHTQLLSHWSLLTKEGIETPETEIPSYLSALPLLSALFFSSFLFLTTVVLSWIQPSFHSHWLIWNSILYWFLSLSW